jgi:hypothetical protein
MVGSIAFLACRDLFVAPPQSQQPQVPFGLKPGDRASTDAYPKESPATITIPLTISDTTGQGRMDSFTSPVFTFTTVMKAVAEGNVTRTPNYSVLGGPTTYGPVGNTGMAWLDGQNVGNGAGFSDSATTYVRFAHGSRGLSASSTNYGAESELDFGPGHLTCGPQYSMPLCVTYSGSRTVTLTRLESTLNFVADSMNVAPGSVVTFTAKANPAVVNGQTIPVEVDSADWTPDAAPYGEAYDSTMSCGFGALGYQCQRRIVGSGTMHVVAYVNGARQEGSVHITTPALTLTATPAYIKTGANVTFTPQWSDGRSTVPDMWYWTWAPDHPPGNTGCGYWEDPCTKPVLETGTMKVQLRRNGADRYATARVVVYSLFALDIDRAVALPGEAAVFTPKYDGLPGAAAKWKFIPDDPAGDHIACDNNVQDCIKVMHGSGTMWAYSSLSSGDSDHKHVSLYAMYDTSGDGAICPSRIGRRPLVARVPVPTSRGPASSQRPVATSRATVPAKPNRPSRNAVGDCVPGTPPNTTIWPCSHTTTMNGRDSLQHQYMDTLLYPARDTVRYTTLVTPHCEDFDTVAHHGQFTWDIVKSRPIDPSRHPSHADSLFDPQFLLALFRPALKNVLDALYALQTYQITSSNRIYSTPHHNYYVDTLRRIDSVIPNTTIKVDSLPGIPYKTRPKLAPNSRHVYGDAADINPNASGEVEWRNLLHAAQRLTGNGICVEPYPWDHSHFHLDTRRAPLAFNQTTGPECGGVGSNKLITIP